MTDQDFISTLPEQEKRFIEIWREKVAGTGADRISCAILGPNSEIIPTDAMTACIWEAHNEDRMVLAKMKLRDGTEISTVFTTMGLHKFGRQPVHFETMVFAPDKSAVEARYATYEEAMKGHERLVAETIRARAEGI
jgi:hypothetical protein